MRGEGRISGEEACGARLQRGAAMVGFQCLAVGVDFDGAREAGALSVPVTGLMIKRDFMEKL